MASFARWPSTSTVVYGVDVEHQTISIRALRRKTPLNHLGIPPSAHRALTHDWLPRFHKGALCGGKHEGPRAPRIECRAALCFLTGRPLLSSSFSLALTTISTTPPSQCMSPCWLWKDRPNYFNSDAGEGNGPRWAVERPHVSLATEDKDGLPHMSVSPCFP